MFFHLCFKLWLRYRLKPDLRASGTLVYRAFRDGNGSVGHGSNGSPFLDGSRGSRVTARDPLSHDDEITDRSSWQF